MLTTSTIAPLVVFTALASSDDPPRFSTTFFEVGPGEASLTCADFNGDGHMDIAVSSLQEATLTLMLGDGSGAFSIGQPLAAGPSPTAVTAADINGDHVPDLLIANHETTQVTLLLGRGDGRFVAAPNSPLRPGIDPHPHLVLAEDMDQDGYVDLLIDQRNQEGVLLLPGKHGGEFDTPRLISVGGDPYRGMAVGDINEDGFPDIVTPNPTAIGVTLNESGRRFRAGPAPVAPGPFSVALGDFNHDGKADIAAATE